ncbi:hypothetical protein CP533_0894 [Ophiocordyceps camponoti-saundersi (nom. inval.)]|nr:hypothetical protein CP533_0894 [Ophiocordyceps camponoti-saundersi (nom. inval.)]
MASLKMGSAAVDQRSGVKITKPRNRMVVKPLLKKLHSHSDRDSLDLDRDWDHQPSSRHQQSFSDPYHYSYHSASATPRSPRDLSFSLAPSEYGGSAAANATAAAAAAAVAAAAAAAAATTGGGTASGAGKGAARAHSFSHVRSASAASHASIATTNSGRNGGSFVHPFQQTPQGTALAYAHSRASLDIVRDCSPTITEDNDDDHEPYSTLHSTTGPRPIAYTQPSQHHHRRPSLASQPPSPLWDANHPSQQSPSSGSPRRLAPASANQSRSELQLSAGASTVDSPLSATAPAVMSGTAGPSPQITAAPSRASSAGPMSPLRSSLDIGGFRLRSRSDIDPVTRKEHVRLARRKFEEKERVKEEKYIRKRERASNREVQKLEREQTKGFRNTSRASHSSGAGSPGLPRTTAPTGLGVFETDEKSAGTHNSSRFRRASQPRAEDVDFNSARRAKTAKHRTMGVWTAFMLWLRTRLLKLGRR